MECKMDRKFVYLHSAASAASSALHLRRPLNLPLSARGSAAAAFFIRGPSSESEEYLLAARTAALARRGRFPIMDGVLCVKPGGGGCGDGCE